MKVVLTNLSDKRFEASRFRLNESAKRFGIEHIYSYDFDDIKQTTFYAENNAILKQRRGIGYWLWKPYIILESLKKVEDNDIVIYSDSGIELIASLTPLIKICREEQPVLLFQNGNLRNSMWTKRDCFILMGCDHKRYWRSIQVDAAFCLFKKTSQTTSFLQQWLQFGQDERIISNKPNVLGKKNLPDFIEHREDQSIVSLLAAMHQVPFYRMPTQYGNHYKMVDYRIPGEFNQINQYRQKQVKFYAAHPLNNSPYGQLLNQHRADQQKVKAQPSVKRSSWRSFPYKMRRKFYAFWCDLEEFISPSTIN